MFTLTAEHPFAPGSVLKLFHGRAAADWEGIKMLRMIGDDIIRGVWSDEHSARWEEIRIDDALPFAEVLEFLRGLENYGGGDPDAWFVEISELQPMDQSDPTAVSPAVLETTGKGFNILDVPILTPGDKLASLDVHALDPAAEVVSTMLGNLANVVETSEAFAPSGDDKAEVIERMVKEAQQAMKVGQEWLDKARPIGKIADDVVRLAGIIVAGTDLHASLSEAMDQHIYDEHDEREPDCHYQAVLDAWTAALAGITVTTPAPAK